jgi:hypothetical protein
MQVAKKRRQLLAFESERKAKRHKRDIYTEFEGTTHQFERIHSLIFILSYLFQCLISTLRD